MNWRFPNPFDNREFRCVAMALALGLIYWLEFTHLPTRNVSMSIPTITLVVIGITWCVLQYID